MKQPVILWFKFPYLKASVRKLMPVWDHRLLPMLAHASPRVFMSLDRSQARMLALAWEPTKHKPLVYSTNFSYTSLLVVGWLWYRRRTAPPSVAPIHDPGLVVAINEQKLLTQLEAKHSDPVDRNLLYTALIYYREGNHQGHCPFSSDQSQYPTEAFCQAGQRHPNWLCKGFYR